MAERRKHEHPSPSHFVGAWCNDSGCGERVPLYEFQGVHYSYLEDGRTLRALVEGLLSSLAQDMIRGSLSSEAIEMMSRVRKWLDSPGLPHGTGTR